MWQGKNGALRMRVESVLKQRDRMMEEAEARENVLKAELEEVCVCRERALARARERERARERKGQRERARPHLLREEKDM